ncbi:MAG: hypothetical protein ACREBJ_02155, partial [Nitrosotalea sp.]
MVTISYKGSGNAAVDSSLLGVGQGLQVGNTKIVFDKGFVQLSDSQGRQVNMGFFSSLQALSSKETTIRSFVFRAKTVCTAVIGKAAYEYINLNEWVTYNYISEQTIEITRSATGQNPDVFDWQFFASDDPKFAFTIQKASRDSETEILFANATRAVNTYTQTSNLRGSRKIIVIGNSPASAETGTAKITVEIQDPATQNWIQIASELDLFTLAQSVFIQKPIGENANKKLGTTGTDYEKFYYRADGSEGITEGGSPDIINLV